MKKILSIQSSVTAGFVGNAVAGPVLLALGHHPMLVNTISLAAHPGYGERAGGPPDDQLFSVHLQGFLKLHGVDDVAAILSGYLGSPGQIAPIADLVTSWRGGMSGKGPYILDPVMGDLGQLYITPELAEGIGGRLLPLADIVTPNQFELGHLTGADVHGREDAVAAAKTLLAQHPLTAVIATGISDHSTVGDLLVCRDGTQDWHVASEMTQNVAGGGDLLTALFSGALAAGCSLAKSFRHASATVQTILGASATPRDLALLENMAILRPSRMDD
ncbi:MAG: PfkB family carbohydrate kinase [Candidatus Puniceispirillaceae bacterium]